MSVAGELVAVENGGRMDKQEKVPQYTAREIEVDATA